MADRPRFGIAWLLALLLILPLGVAALFIAVFSMAECPQPVHRQNVWTSWGKYRCFRCRDRGRITLLDKWRDGEDSWEPWEGMEISTITVIGFLKHNRQLALDLAGIRPGIRMTHRLKQEATQKLWGTDSYETVEITVLLDSKSPGKVEVRIDVKER